MNLPENITDRELLARFALWRAPGVGPAFMAECLTAFQSVQTLFENKNTLPENVRVTIQQADFKNAEKDVQWLSSSPHHHLALLATENYPPALAEISAAPPWLFVKGNAQSLSLAQIALVGSRNPTHYGLKVAEQLATALVRQDMVVTSGLALGIDAACHQAALNAQGKTIAVLAIGLDEVYPKRHRALAEAILENEGALVSEFGMGTKPLPENFPRRNRIISGLSLGTVVIEASIKSGSLITARYAAEQGREVFAVPGSVFQSLSQGCHYLIKQGAKCVEQAEDILQELSRPVKKISEEKEDPKPISVSLSEQHVLKIVHDIPQSFESLREQLQWTVAQLQVVLSQLQLKTLVQKDWAGYSRVGP